jgi:hypothetical protein
MFILQVDVSLYPYRENALDEDMITWWGFVKLEIVDS